MALSFLLRVAAFVLILLATLVLAASISGINPEVFAWGGLDAFVLSFIVP
jgi:hypothetical protein